MERKKENRQKFTTTMDKGLIWRAKVQAAKEGRSVSAIVEELLTRYLAEKR